MAYTYKLQRRYRFAFFRNNPLDLADTREPKEGLLDFLLGKRYKTKIDGFEGYLEEAFFKKARDIANLHYVPEGRTPDNSEVSRFIDANRDNLTAEFNQIVQEFLQSDARFDGYYTNVIEINNVLDTNFNMHSDPEKARNIEAFFAERIKRLYAKTEPNSFPDLQP